MRKKLLVFTVIAALILAVAGAAAAAPREAWTADPKTGVKICIVFHYDDQALVSASWFGPAVDGKAEGKGVLNYSYKGEGGKETSVRADAEMKAGKLDGKASAAWSDGDTYEGYYKEGMIEGKGSFKRANGRVYAGDFKAGRPHGKGVLKDVDGRVYDGDWVDGIPHGKGVLRWPDGQTYEGDYRNGARDGFGVQKDPAGKIIYSGEWKNDKPVQKAD